MVQRRRAVLQRLVDINPSRQLATHAIDVVGFDLTNELVHRACRRHGAGAPSVGRVVCRRVVCGRAGRSRAGRGLALAAGPWPRGRVSASFGAFATCRQRLAPAHTSRTALRALMVKKTRAAVLFLALLLSGYAHAAASDIQNVRTAMTRRRLSWLADSWPCGLCRSSWLRLKTARLTSAYGPLVRACAARACLLTQRVVCSCLT